MLTRASLSKKNQFVIFFLMDGVTLAEQVLQCQSRMELVGNRTLEKFFDDAYCLHLNSQLVLLLCSKVDEVGSHAVLLTTPQLIHT